MTVGLSLRVVYRGNPLYDGSSGWRIGGPSLTLGVFRGNPLYDGRVIRL
jgi:hypothetical protein